MSGAALQFLFIIRSGPDAGSTLAETVDMILTLAAFDHCVRVAFIDEGVRYLTAVPSSVSEREQRERGMIAALDLYEVREVIVGRESLRARGLDEPDVRIAATVVPEIMIASLIAGHQRVQIA